MSIFKNTRIMLEATSHTDAVPTAQPNMSSLEVRPMD